MDCFVVQQCRGTLYSNVTRSNVPRRTARWMHGKTTSAPQRHVRYVRHRPLWRRAHLGRRASRPPRMRRGAESLSPRHLMVTLLLLWSEWKESKTSPTACDSDEQSACQNSATHGH
jgi:hypothetical protein